VPATIKKHRGLSPRGYDFAEAERVKYDAYGKQTVLADNGVVAYKPSDYGQFVGFTGRYHDYETGLQYFRARYFDNTLGRFIQRDPLLYESGFNLYSSYFSPNDLDPLGLNPCIKIREALEKATKAADANKKGMAETSKTIEQLKKSIARREGHLDTNPRNLTPFSPEVTDFLANGGPWPAGPGSPAESILGHLPLIIKDKAALAAHEANLVKQAAVLAIQNARMVQLATQLLACETREVQRLTKNLEICTKTCQRMSLIRRSFGLALIVMFIFECPGDTQRDTDRESPEPEVENVIE
jgi:RHS repeat-associated protein